MGVLARLRVLAPHAVGYSAIGLIIVGIWGLFGWEWAAIATGLPPASFYVWGQIRSARTPTIGEVD